jgi:hypothetical protein
MQFNYASAFLPDTDDMCEHAMIETTIYMALATSASYVVQALDQNTSVIASINVVNPVSQIVWGQFVWGQSLWGGASAALYPQRIDWSFPVVFRRMIMNVMGSSAQQFRVGTIHMRYEKLGYLQQTRAAAA